LAYVFAFARIGDRHADCVGSERRNETVKYAAMKFSLQWRRKTAISSAVRGTPNRHCGIAAAL